MGTRGGVLCTETVSLWAQRDFCQRTDRLVETLTSVQKQKVQKHLGLCFSLCRFHQLSRVVVQLCGELWQRSGLHLRSQKDTELMVHTHPLVCTRTASKAGPGQNRLGSDRVSTGEATWK